MKHAPSDKACFEKYALMALTSSCNQKCIFCFESGIRYEIPDTKVLYKNLDELSKRGFSKIVFISGEVTLVPDLPEIISHITSRGMKAHIATNGLKLADRDFLKSLLDAGLRHIEFSIHSHRPHDSLLITGCKDSFSRQLAALDNISELAPLYQPRLTFNTNTVVTSVNAGYLPELARFVLRNKNANALSFKYPTFEGRMRRNPDCAVRFSDLIPALEEIQGMAAQGGITMILDGFPLCVLPQSMIGNTVIFQDMASMLFGFNYSQRVSNLRFDLLPAVKASPKCRGCVASPMCIGMPGEYIEMFSDGEARPYPSFFELNEDVRDGVISCLVLRDAKVIHVADPVNIRQWDADGIECWVRGTLAAADDDGAVRVVFDLTYMGLDNNMSVEFFKAFSRYSNRTLPLVRCRAEMFSDPLVLHAFKPHAGRIELEALFYSCDEEIQNELSGDKLFKQACMGIMALVECGASPDIFTPVLKRNAGALEQLVHFAGMAGVRGIILSCGLGEESGCPRECTGSNRIKHALNTARREYPKLKMTFRGGSLECLPQWHSHYRPPFSRMRKDL